MMIVIDIALVSLGASIGFAVAALCAINKSYCTCDDQFQKPEAPATAKGLTVIYLAREEGKP